MAELLSEFLRPTSCWIVELSVTAESTSVPLHPCSDTPGAEIQPLGLFQVKCRRDVSLK